MRGEQSSQLFLHSRLHQRAVPPLQRQAVQNQAVDVQLDFHATTPGAALQRKSASLIDRSSLRNSVRAAANIKSIVTGVPACAARKAALSAMLWMCPPVRL